MKTKKGRKGKTAVITIMNKLITKTVNKDRKGKGKTITLMMMTKATAYDRQTDRKQETCINRAKMMGGASRQYKSMNK